MTASFYDIVLSGVKLNLNDLTALKLQPLKTRLLTNGKPGEPLREMHGGSQLDSVGYRGKAKS